MKDNSITTPIGEIYPVEDGFYDCTSHVITKNDDIWEIHSATTSLTISDTEYHPKLYQSCMNPDIVKVIPLIFTISETEHMICLQWEEQEIIIDYTKEHVTTKRWQGSLKKRGCENCTGCGRC